MLIEVLVSAVVLVLVAGAVLALLGATARSSADQRHRSEAYALAQEDQARMRSMRISELVRLPKTPINVTFGGTKFEIYSTGVFVNDKTAIPSCSAGKSSADYLRISSEVRWGGMGAKPVVIQSIVSPSNGSVDSSHGTVTLAVTGVNEVPKAGVTYTGSGLSGVTDENGCVTFPDLAVGTYTLIPGGTASNLVEENGKTPVAVEVKATAELTNVYPFKYDTPGSAKISFTTKKSAASPPAASTATSVAFAQAGKALRTFSAPGGNPATSITGSSLYPFPSAYAAYAGTCAGNNPNPEGIVNPPGAAAMASVLVTSSTTQEVSIQLPALYLTVFKGTPTKPETAVNAAHVVIEDKNCGTKRTFATESLGGLTDPGLPWGGYKVCADNGIRKHTASSTVNLDNLVSGTPLKLYLGSGSGSVSTSVSTNGPCS